MFNLIALKTFLTLAISISPAFATLYQGPANLPNKNYDYIVVGAGAGGGVIANRLTEDSSVTVLLIEAGSSDYQNQDIVIPWLAPALQGSQFDWNFTTVDVAGLNGRSIPYTRGHVLGGSTAINYMAYCRGSEDDYARWASVTGDDTWSWDQLYPYIIKMESLVPPADGHDTTGDIDPSVHGTSGPLAVSLPGQLLPTDNIIISATSELSDEFPYNEDYNSGDTIGIGWVPSTIADGARVDSATAYIAPALSRSNLDVLVNTQVTHVLQTGTQSGLPVFRGVQFAQSASGPVYSLTANNEVILSAGAVKTPHILMLSGIGDSSVLSSFGINTIVDIPDVGQNLQDHPLITSSWVVNSTNTLDNLTLDTAFFNQEMSDWQQNRRGELVLGPTNQIGWLRLPSNSSIFESTADPSAGPKSGHYEFITTDGFVSFSSAFPDNGDHFYTMFTVLVSPSSRGSITISSTNPFDHPVINPNFYDTEFDIFAAREAVKAARRFTSASVWTGYLVEEYGAFAQAQTDDEIESYLRTTTETINHASGTAAMGKTGSSGPGTGVLNSDLTVKGTVGLRVVDASAFPFIPAAHTQVPVYLLAERAADLIKAAADSCKPKKKKCIGFMCFDSDS